MKKIFLAVLFLTITFLFSLNPIRHVLAQSDDEKLQELQQQITQFQQQLDDARGQEKTLKGQLDYIDVQTKLTQAKVDETNYQITKLEKEINDLSSRIVRLSSTVDSITQVLLTRIIQTYKYGNYSAIDLLFSSNGFSDLLQRMKYIQVAQANDKKVLYQLQATKATYNDQKTDKVSRQTQQEKLKNDLSRYQEQLTIQKKEKDALLLVTQNNEAKYQSLLAQARAEYMAIQGIIAGQGKESEVGPVSQGQRIATVINGPSCNSGGPHLHFTVVQNGSTLNPFSYLKSVDYQNCSGSSCDSSDSDSFNPSGSWDWPLNPSIKMNQGYGNTWAVNHSYVGNIYRFHNGLDIEGSSLEVKTVKAGTLFRGSYSGKAGCALPYVRVKHSEGELDTLYLHVYY